MKNILLIVIIAFSLNVKAQITLEQTYDSASTYSSPINQLMIINFEVSGERYVRINREGKTIDIYNMNHSLTKSISYAGFPQTSNQQPTILYLSENLFNMDPKIEFMYIYTQENPPIVYTRIYNEDGLLIFQADSLGPLIWMSAPLQQFPIYNTSQGTKMILSHQYNGKAYVYSLPGTLSSAIEETNGQLIQTQYGQLGNLYPNPSNGSVTLQYQLPKGESSGELILYNMQGIEVKRYKVDNTFSNLQLDNTQLPAGTYFYQLKTKKGTVGTKKMVVIK